MKISCVQIYKLILKPPKEKREKCRFEELLVLDVGDAFDDGTSGGVELQVGDVALEELGVAKFNEAELGSREFEGFQLVVVAM